jgi:drug/metabolite transporter (DMT)-like permease
MSSALRGRTLAVYCFLCAVWGSTWLVIKIGLEDLPPLRFAAFRMAAACVLLLPFAFRRGTRRPGPRELKFIALAGFLQIGVSYALVFVAEQWIGSGLTALLFGTFPIWVGLFAHSMLPNEPLTRLTLGAAALGVAGVALIQGPAVVRTFQSDPGALLRGGGLVFGSAIVSAFSNIIIKKHLGKVDPARNVWGETLVGSAFLLLLAGVFERGAPARWTPAAWGSLAYLTIFGTALTFVGLFWLIKRVPVSIIGTIPLVDTLIAVVLGAIVLGEKLPARTLAGGALILGGVFLITRGGHSEAAAGV